jgi:ABC-type glycerol-3-phosphate transport system substrate-binding protein
MVKELSLVSLKAAGARSRVIYLLSTMQTKRLVIIAFTCLSLSLCGGGCVSTPSKKEMAFYYKKGSTREEYERLDSAAREFSIRKTKENLTADVYSLDPSERYSAMLLAEAYRDAYFTQQGWKRVYPKYAERRWAKEAQKKANSSR